MENLTKESLNIQIVLMRRLMKKVKAMTINSLIKKSRKLKKANTTKTFGNVPCRKDKKLDRILMEIQEIKKLNADEITKFALMHIVTFSQVAKMGSCKERALARLAEQTILKNAVSQFRTKYPKWEVQIPSLFHIWEFNKKVMRKNLKDKPKNVLENAKTREIQSKEVKSSMFEKPTPSQALHGAVSGCVQEIESCVDVSSKPSLKQLSADLKFKQSHDVKKTDGDIEVKRINLDEIVSEIPVENTSKSKQCSDTNSITLKNQHKINNSFFITFDNDLGPSDDDKEEKELNYDEHIDSTKLHPNKRSAPIPWSKSTSFSRGGGERKSFKGNPHVIDTLKSMRTLDLPGKNHGNRPPPSETSRAVNLKMPRNIMQSDSKLETANLHPSWQAKRNQNNTMLTAFVGKKIRFDDD